MASNLNPSSLINDTAIDIDAELQNLLGNDPIILNLPKSIDAIIEVLLPLRRFTVQHIAARLKRIPPGTVDEIYWKRLAAFLHAMFNLEFVDPKMKSKALLDKALEAIFDPANKFPANYARVARYIYEKLEAERWGADEAEMEGIFEDDMPDVDSFNSTTSASTNRERKVTTPLRDLDFPADNDPIYGLNGIMHHILRVKGAKKTSYQIHPNFRCQNAKVFGHNGLKVGACWPNQIALLRDGGHGQKMGGISGNTVDGTYSIVVSGLYDDLDRDEGDTLFYSGSNSHNNTASEPVTSNNTKALERSTATQKPVRVFRSALGKWKHVPRAGLRYDGLYLIKSMTVEKNVKGGAYKRFKLERIRNQDDIRTHLPSQNQISLFGRVKEGYTLTRPRLAPAV